MACESVGVDIFRHLQAKRMFNFYLSSIKSENKSMTSSLKYHFSYNSFRRKNIAEIFFYDHDVTNVFDNDRSAIMSMLREMNHVDNF